MKEAYLKEGMDIRRLFLLFLGKLWIGLIAALLGALIGAGAYLLTHLVVMSQRQYQSVSKVYLDFDVKPEDMVHLAYNGYTWNDLMDTDPILNETMDRLPEGISREVVSQATDATILSDIRLLTVTVTAGEAELTDQITEATLQALKHLGETEPLFREIAIYSTGESALILWDNKTARAAVTGCMIGIFLYLAGAAAWYVLDDSLYVALDGAGKLGVKTAGILTKKTQKSLPVLEEICFINLKYFLSQGSVAVVHPDGEAAAGTVVSDLKELFHKQKEDCGEGLFEMELPGAGNQKAADRTDVSGILLAVPYGCKNGSRMKMLLESMELRGLPVKGILITEADVRFLKAYYFPRKAADR